MSLPSYRQTLTIVYNPWKKLLALLSLALVLWLVWIGLHSNFFILEIALVLLTAYAFRNIIDIVATQSIGFYPNKIVKTGYLGEVTIPTASLVITDQSQDRITRFVHGSDDNSRESINVYRWFLSLEVRLWLDNYRRNAYRKDDVARTSVNAKVPMIEFIKAISAFRVIAVLTVVYLLLYVLLATFLNGHYPIFKGYAPNLPIAMVRLMFIAAALGVYLVLKQLDAPLPLASGSQTMKIQLARKQSFRAALLANGVIWLGLPLFLLSGNKLDFYLLLLIGIGYYHSFYPRLSDWERLLQAGAPAYQSVPANASRRSLQVSLVLLGGMSLAGYADGPEDFRIRQQNCPDNNGTECQGGSGSNFSSSRFFGGSNSHSWIRRGGFGSSGSSHFSFGG
jgi:hypothetical protein